MTPDLTILTHDEVSRLLHAYGHARVDQGGHLDGFVGVRVEGYDFSMRDMHGLHFDDSHFIRCNFSGAVLRDSTFSSTTAAGCDFSNADMVKIEIHSSNLAGCIFEHTKLIRAVIVGCDLTNASFFGADLTAVAVSDCRLRGARFDGAELNGALFEDNEDQEREMSNPYRLPKD